MIKGIVKGLAKLTLVVAGAAFIIGISFMVMSSYFATYPLLRLSFKERRTRVILGVVQALMVAGQTFASNNSEVDESSPIN